MKDWKADSIRGRASEQNTRAALKELLSLKEITSYRSTDWGSRDDRSGIDFYFSLNIKGKRVEVPLQVKSSKFGMAVHHGKYGDIHCVNGQSPDLKRQIQAIIMDYRIKLGSKTSEETESMAIDATKLTVPPQANMQQITAPSALKEMAEGQKQIIKLLEEMIVGINNTQQILLTGLGRTVSANPEKLSGEALRQKRSETMKLAQAKMVETKRAEKIEKIKKAIQDFPTLAGNLKVISQLAGVGLKTIQNYKQQGLI